MRHSLLQLGSRLLGTLSLDTLLLGAPLPGQTPRPLPPVLRGDTVAFDSLVRRLMYSTDTAERRRVGTLLAMATLRQEPVMHPRLLGLTAAHPDDAERLPGEADLGLLLLRTSAPAWPRAQHMLPAALAARILTTLANTDSARQPSERSRFFIGMLDAFANGLRVEPSAFDTIAALARRVGDARRRDMLLIAAYLADPARGRPLVDSLAGPTGYGPVARALVRGNASALYESYGVAAPDSTPHRGTPFPGIDAPWQAHDRYLDSQNRNGRSAGELAWLAGGPMVSPINLALAPVVASWLEARRLEPRSALRARFALERSPRGRLIWAHYLLLLNDTSALPWLRATARDSADSASAYQLLERHAELAAETLRGGAVVAELQRAMLQYVMGESELVDQRGEPVRGSSRQAEINARTPAPLLESAGLDPSVAESWGNRFRLLPDSALAARRDSIGLFLAYHISPITRIVDRYYVSVSRRPWAFRPCTCGGGSIFTLVRHGARWVVLDQARWVS